MGAPSGPPRADNTSIACGRGLKRAVRSLFTPLYHFIHVLVGSDLAGWAHLAHDARLMRANKIGALVLGLALVSLACGSHGAAGGRRDGASESDGATDHPTDHRGDAADAPDAVVDARPDLEAAADATDARDATAEAPTIAPRLACSSAAGVNTTAGLDVLQPDLSAREIVTSPSSKLVRIDRDPSTGHIVVMSQDGKFWTLDPGANTVTPTETDYTFEGDHRGMVFAADGTLYTLALTGATGTTAFTLRKGAPAATGRAWSTVATSEAFPASGTPFDAGFNALLLSPDGTSIFIGAGARTDHGEMEAGLREVPLSSAILRVPTASTNLLLPNDAAMLSAGGYLYADGLHNVYDMAFDPDGDLIAADTGPQWDLPDEVDWIQAGQHFGFPWRFGAEGNPVLDPTYTPQGDARLHFLVTPDYTIFEFDPTFPTPPAGAAFVDPIPNFGPDADRFRPGRTGGPMDASDLGISMPGITGHRTPLGLSFDTTGALCGDYYEAGFMLSYGASVNAFNDPGRDLLLVQLTKTAGQYKMNATKLVELMQNPIDAVLVGNALYTIGYGNGPIYEIKFPAPAQP